MLEVQRQAELEESRGVLLKILELGAQCIAVYDFGAVELPEDLAAELRKLIGHKISVLRLDGFHVRDLGAEDATT